MVRTKANNAAVRKAVAAKAPRKNVAPVRTLISPSSSKSKISKRSAGGNAVKAWPTPSWQKGIQLFLTDEPGLVEASAGCSSSSKADDAARERLMDNPKMVTEEENGSDQEEINEEESGSDQEQIDEEASGSEQEHIDEEESGSEQEHVDEEESGSEQEHVDEEESGSEQEGEEDNVQEASAPTAKLLSDDIATLGSDDDD